MKKIIGRISETYTLSSSLNSNQSELIAIHGRRRVGKTFLVRTIYKKHFVFEFSGIHQEPLKKQLKNFYLELKTKFKSATLPTDWLEAFFQLRSYIDSLKSTKKKVIFFDEFPWLDTRKSGFLAAFDNFWNNYATKRDDLVVVVCGSAASYMIQNIIENKGGLHNRITQQIHLKPFTLLETEQLLKAKNIRFSRYDILHLYMALGGIPHYLDKIENGESVPQIIDRLCFQQNSFLRKEFKVIFASLFDHHENHEHLLRLLSTVRKGFTRNEILKKSKLNSGGTLTKTLRELEASGFITKYSPYKNTKDALYRLTDEYSLFYIRFIEPSSPSNSQTWLNLHNLQSFKSWSGFTFETICIKHVEQLKEALKIRGIHSTDGSWVSKNNEENVQIDLLIDRNDRVINLCEMKFYDTHFKIDKKTAENIQKKINVFKAETQTNKNIFVTFISTYGLKRNMYSNQYVQNDLNINSLFTQF
jgi:AAA+ ATPase superfamily predicted ATPase